MKIFVLEHVEQVSGNYHSDGGLVVVARDIEEAKKLVEREWECKPTDEEWGQAMVYELKEGYETKCYVFPDAGCC